MYSRRLQIILAILFCFTFALAGYNVMINGHFHTDAFGHIIFHAHPFAEHDSTHHPVKTHSHTRLQLLICEIITTLIFLLTFALLLIRLLFPASDWLGSIFSQSFTPYSLILLPFRRGPPSI